MAATKQTIRIIRGATFKDTWTIYNNDGTPKDLAAGRTSGAMWIKRAPWGQVLAFAESISTNTIGMLSVIISAAETAKLTERHYIYDIRLTYADSVDIHVGGDVIVTPGVST